MNLLPIPNTILLNNEFFYISPETKIVLDNDCNSEDLESALILKEEIKSTLGFDVFITKSFFEKENNIIYLKNLKSGDKEGYTLEVKSCKTHVIGNDSSGLFYGVQTLRQIIREQGAKVRGVYIKDEPFFKARGFYHDVTRGKVPTLSTLKALVDKCAFYKLNQLQLYIEHSFAFNKFTELWADADPLTAEEILILDAYAKKRHVELVPSIATFGHLYQVLISKSFCDLCELEDSDKKGYSWIERTQHHTLNVSCEESLEFVKSMLEEYIPLFSSNKFNICCDETFDLGKGKSKDLVNEKGQVAVYVEFLNKVIDIVKQHGKQAMFWGDIILNQPELANKIPKDVICLNWNYHPQSYQYNFELMSEIRDLQYGCPSTAACNQIMSSIDASFSNINTVVRYGKKYNAVGILNTDWGDNGHINLLSSSIPSVIYAAALSWNPESTKVDFDDMYKKISFVEYGDKSEKLVDLLSELHHKQNISHRDLVLWYEHKFLNKGWLDNENTLNGFLSPRVEQSEIKSQRAYAIEKEILNIFSKAAYTKDKVLNVNELYVISEGIRIYNSLYLIIKKYEFNHEVPRLMDKPKDLAEKIELWFRDFSKVWRMRNKESELFRLKDMYKTICNWLRNI